MPKADYKRWKTLNNEGVTDEDILRKLVKDEMPAVLIARKMKRTTTSVEQRISILGIRKEIGYFSESIAPLIKPEVDIFTEACTTLHGRVREKSGAYFLDGRPAHFDTIMQTANALRARWGLEQLGRKPEWHSNS